MIGCSVHLEASVLIFCVIPYHTRVCGGARGHATIDAMCYVVRCRPTFTVLVHRSKKGPPPSSQQYCLLNSERDIDHYSTSTITIHSPVIPERCKNIVCVRPGGVYHTFPPSPPISHFHRRVINTATRNIHLPPPPSSRPSR